MPSNDDSTVMYRENTVPRILPWNSHLCRILTRDLPITSALLRGCYKFSLFTVREAVIKYIKQYGLYDRANSAIIISNPDLKKALGVGTFLLSNLDHLLKQILKVDDNFHTFMLVDLTSEKYDSDDTNYNTNSLFWVKPHLREILNSVQPIRNNKSAFTYASICALLGEYIVKHQDKLIDPTDSSICNCKGTELAKALQVSGFHRSQVHTLIKKQIRPLTSFYIRNRAKKPTKLKGPHSPRN